MRQKIYFLLLSCILIAAMAVAAGAEVQTSYTHPSDGLLWPVYRFGTNKPPVKSLQYLLRTRGYSVVADGKFGKQTQDAVKRYQWAHHLKVNGIVEANTWESLVMTLRKGSHGDAVRAMQTALNWQFKNWNDPGKKKPKPVLVDGDFGNATEKAVKFFQRATINVLDESAPSGIIGKSTWCYLVGGRLDGE